MSIGIRQFSGPTLPVLIPECCFAFHVVPDVEDEPGTHILRAVHVAPDGGMAYGHNFDVVFADIRPGMRRQGATFVWTWAGLPLSEPGQHAVRVVTQRRTLSETPFYVTVDPLLPEVGCGY